VAKVFVGHDGVRAFWRQWLQAWESLEFKTVPEDLGDRVVVDVRQRNRGRASGVEVVFHYFQVFTIRDGKVTAVHVADNRADAVAASEPVE
jgi:ketosteroid isomerase-like protein